MWEMPAASASSKERGEGWENGVIVFHALHRSGISMALSSPQLATMRLRGTCPTARKL